MKFKPVPKPSSAIRNPSTNRAGRLFPQERRDAFPQVRYRMNNTDHQTVWTQGFYPRAKLGTDLRFSCGTLRNVIDVNRDTLSSTKVLAMAEVTIKGAGIIGLSIARECIQRGAKVQVIDPHGIGAGSSGGIVGALAPHVPENWNEKKAFQFESLQMAQTFWEHVDRTSGLNSGYARTGRIQPLLDEAGLSLANERGQNAKSLWQGMAEWRVVDQQPEWAPPRQRGSGYTIA